MQKEIVRKGIVLGIVLLFLGTSGISAIAGNKNQIKNTDEIKQNDSSTSTNTLSIVSHLITQEEINDMKARNGIYDPTRNYNKIYDGHGTGLAPPTEEEYDSMVGSIHVVDHVTSSTPLPTAVDLSSDPCFPEVRNQDGQGSCAAWASGYYNMGYLQAKNRGWTDASTGNNNHLLSPAFIFNKNNEGTNKTAGSTFYGNYATMDTIGICRWTTMSYSADDYTSWGDENAWRDAPLYRSINTSIIYAQNTSPYFDDNDITLMKSLLNSGHPINFAILADDYNNTNATDDTLGSSEVTQDYNHANTIVGYSDAKVDPDTGEIGAFKAVNSWGAIWGPLGNGYYWITYKAVKQKIIGDMYYLSIRYPLPTSPTLLEVWKTQAGANRDAKISMGIGVCTSVRQMSFNYQEGIHGQTFPVFMCIDVSEFYPEWASGTTDFHLTVGDSAYTDANVLDLWVEYYKNGYVPSSPTRCSNHLVIPQGQYWIDCPATMEVFFPVVYNINKQQLYPDISTAVTDANTGDTLEISPGTYHERDININKKLI